MPTARQLRDLYRFPGFAPAAQIGVARGDPEGVMLTLRRRRKKRAVVGAVSVSPVSMISGRVRSETLPAATAASISPSRCVGSIVGVAAA